MADNLELLTRPRMNNRPGKTGLLELLGIQKAIRLSEVDERAPGIDISGYQTGINWLQVGMGLPSLAYMFIKSTESNWYYSSSYRSQWDNAGMLGIPRGTYHFWRGNVSGAAQAAWFLQKSSKGELPPVLDVEDADNVPQNLTAAQKLTYANNIKAWLDAVQNAYQQVPIVYSGKWFWDRLGLVPWANNYPGWFAHYKPLDNIGPLRPIGWDTYTFWQWTSGLTYSGFPEHIDGDVFNGTRTEFATWAGITQQLTDHEILMRIWAAHPELH